MSISDLDREVSILAPSWTLAVGVTPGDVAALWDQAREAHDAAYLRHLNRSTPREASVDIYVADDDGQRVLSLFLGPSRLARLQR